MESNLKEIAKRAGVSVTTVSRVLNNRGRIAQKTRQRILELAHTRHCPRLVLIVLPASCEMLGWYTLTLLNAMELRATQLDYTLVWITSKDLVSLPEQNFFGIISFDYNNHLANFLGKRYALPFVCLNDIGKPIDGICSVFSDEMNGMAQAINYLASYNHQRIGLLTYGNPETFANQSRHDSYLAMMERFGLKNHTKILHLNELAPYGTVKELCENGITAIVNLSENTSCQILYALQFAGLRIPQDISLIAMELPYVSEFQNPPLTTLEQNHTTLAAVAFDTLERIAQGERTSFTQPVPYLFHKRASVTFARSRLCKSQMREGKTF